MNEQEENTFSVTVMNKTYKVKCPTEKIDELRQSAVYLDEKMREISQSQNQVISVDRVAVIAALNITHELLIQKKQKNLYIDTINQRIEELHHKLATALGENVEQEASA